MAVLASQQTLQPAGIMGNGAYLRKNGTTNHQQYNGPSRSEYDRSSTNTTLLSLGNAQRSSQPSHLTNGNTPTHIASSVDPELSREKPSEGQPALALRPSHVRRNSRKNLVRARTELNLHSGLVEEKENPTEQNWELRHGWEDQYNSEEYLQVLSSAFYMYYTDKRHESGGKPKDEQLRKQPKEDWAHKDRTKTVSAALVVCLNLGVDPPDVVKTSPCAVTECWIDPTALTSSNPKILETIGKKLQEHYENLSIKTRYKQYLDPSLDEMKKFCTSLRRNAKDERVLYHYNGHGVPLPTPSGEIWVFNRDYTQYIPVALYDLQHWLGGPSLYIFDCSHAGNIIANFDKYAEKHETENADKRREDPNVQLQSYGNNIQLAACGRSELLPTNPKLPADLFTCCLTTPIDICVRFHIFESPLDQDSRYDGFTKVPGRVAERRSPKGELNWILTAITDTIAWNVLPRHLFRRLFRQDLMVAALFRNFLVAERIMTNYGCHPMSVPQIPSTHDHPLWEAWDLAVEMVVAQLPDMLLREARQEDLEYQHSNFFTEQLTAFEVYLQQGAPRKELPTQLPIVLQVLLSQTHRLRALVLLSKFLDMGPWAVNLSLTIGIFPYVVKLLQSPAMELKPIMVFIWARVVAVAPVEAQTDLLRDNGFKYFANILFPDHGLPVANLTEHQAMCTFVLAMFCRGFEQAKHVCLSPDLFHALIGHLQNAENPLLRQWSCLCISMMWSGYPEAMWVGIRCQAHHRLCELFIDPVPEVRTAAIYALTSFLGIPDLTEQVVEIEKTVASVVMVMATDGNAMVRKELLVFYSTFVKRYRNKFLVAAYETLDEELDYLVESGLHQGADSGQGANSPHAECAEKPPKRKQSQNQIQGVMWYQLLMLTVDAHPEVAQMASAIVEYVHAALLDSPLASQTQRIINRILDMTPKKAGTSSQTSSVHPSEPSRAPTADRNHHQKNESYGLSGIKRISSVAAIFKYMTGSSNSSDNLSNNQPPPMTAQQKRMSGPVRQGVPAEWSTPPDQHDPTSSPAKYQKARKPLPRGFKERDSTEEVELPLKSGFFEWSIEYFREPQMKAGETDEPGSDDYNSRLWRRVRNERMLAQTQPLKSLAGTSQWDKDAGFFNNGSQPTKISFHQFEDHLAIADDLDSICIWNWQQRALLSRFSNGNPKNSRITEARFINEDDQALLMTGSSDGVIKIFRNYESTKAVELVSAFRALTDMVPSNKNAGLVFDWQQGQGKLLVAGDVKVIRVWNAATEICTNDIPARSGSCITSLTSDQVAGNVFCAGYGDGAVRIFDQRLKPAMAMVRVWRQHKQWITNVHMQRGGQRELISGSREGNVKLWDIRMEQPLREIVATRDTLRTLSVHEHAPVFATGSDGHTLKLFNANGAFLNTVKPFSPFLSSTKGSPIACAAFHPHRMMVAAGSVGNGYVNVYTCA